MKLENIIKEMELIFATVPYCIDHTMQVLHNAQQIIRSEKIIKKNAEIIQLSAILHDIGACEAKRKYGCMNEEYQELEGPPIAAHILKKHRYSESNIERICYIIAHHHTPSAIDSINFQILWEADLIECMQIMIDIRSDDKLLIKFIDDNFKTQTGKKIALMRYLD